MKKVRATKDILWKDILFQSRKKGIAIPKGTIGIVEYEGPELISVRLEGIHYSDHVNVNCVTVVRELFEDV